jgi:hypothetical protein
MTGRFNGRIQFVVGLVAHSSEDVGDLWAPDGGIVLSTPCLPQDTTFDWVLDQDAVLQ